MVCADDRNPAQNSQLSRLPPARKEGRINCQWLVNNPRLGQAAEIARLEKQLMSVDDNDLQAIVTAIKRRDLTKAWKLEVRTLLRLAS